MPGRIEKLRLEPAAPPRARRAVSPSSRDLRPHQYARHLVGPDANFLPIEAEDARAPRPDHLQLGADAQPHLAEPVDNPSTDDLADLPRLSHPQERQRDQAL